MARKSSSPIRDSHSDSSADNEIEHAEGDADADLSDGEEQSHESEPQNDDESEQEEGEEEEKQESEDDGDEDESLVSAKEPSVQKELSAAEGSESSEKSGSGQDQGQDSGSEFEESPAATVKPIRTKPMEAGVKKSDPKKSEPKSIGKRVMESVQKGHGSRKKAKVTKGDEEKRYVNRLWSEEDEIGILQGMIDYKLEKKEDPSSDFDAFHEFVKDSFHVDVSMKQLTDKIRRLKKKYLLNVQKGNVSFVKPHEEKSFRLSKKIWGGGDGGSGKANGVDGGSSKGRVSRRKDKRSGKAMIGGANGNSDVVMGNGGENGDDIVAEEDKDVDFQAMYPYMSRAWDSDVTCSHTLKDFMTESVGLIGSRKMNEMEKEWKDICLKEMKLYVRKLDVKRKLAQVALDQMTSDS